jgi:hypothetical protein
MLNPTFLPVMFVSWRKHGLSCLKKSKIRQFLISVTWRDSNYVYEPKLTFLLLFRLNASNEYELMPFWFSVENLNLFEIWGSQGGKNEDNGLLRSDAVQPSRYEQGLKRGEMEPGPVKNVGPTSHSESQIHILQWNLSERTPLVCGHFSITDDFLGP